MTFRRRIRDANILRKLGTALRLALAAAALLQNGVPFCVITSIARIRHAYVIPQSSVVDAELYVSSYSFSSISAAGNFGAFTDAGYSYSMTSVTKTKKKKKD